MIICYCEKSQKEKGRYIEETKGDELQCRNSTQVVEFLKSQEDKIKKVENYHK